MLAKRAKSLTRKKQVHNFNTAKTAGILFDAGNADDFTLVKEFGKYLSLLNIECNMVGYLNADEVRSDLLFRDGISIFCNKDLDFFFRPNHPDVLNFVTKKTDMLIDLSLSDLFPLRYITTLSPAMFKVGRYIETSNDLDLMIDIKSQSNLGFLIEQIKNYVTLLNNSKAPINN